jgi:hypothetical protein
MRKTGSQEDDMKLTETEKRQAIRDMLTKRYHGAIEVTDEMIDAILSRI